MTPKTRKRLVQQWQRFSRAIEAQFAMEDSAHVDTVGDTVADARAIARIVLARGTYLKGLVETGLLKPTDPMPDDNSLWEMHPINIEDDNGCLYDRF